MGREGEGERGGGERTMVRGGGGERRMVGGVGARERGGGERKMVRGVGARGGGEEYWGWEDRGGEARSRQGAFLPSLPHWTSLQSQRRVPLPHGRGASQPAA